MSSRKTVLAWRLAYGVCCLVYVAWMAQLASNNFEMVHRHYRQAVERLQPAQIAEIAHQELVDQYYNDATSGARFSPPAGFDLSLPTNVVEARQKEVRARLLGQRNLAGRKLVLFYISFGSIFLILPPVVFYLLLSFLVWLFRNLKFTAEQ